MSAEEWSVSPELLEAAIHIQEERPTGWLNEDGTVRRPPWLDTYHREDEAGNQYSITVPPFQGYGDLPTEVEKTGQELDELAERIQASIKRAAGVIALSNFRRDVNAIDAETAALERLRSNERPQHITSADVAKAEAVYKERVEPAAEGLVFLRDREASKAAYARERETLQQAEAAETGETLRPTTPAPGSSEAITIVEGYQLANGTVISGKPGELLAALARETAGFRSIRTPDLVEQVYPGSHEATRGAFSFAMNTAKQNLQKAGAAERICNLTPISNKEAQYILLPPNAGFSNFEVSSVISFLVSKRFEMADLGIPIDENLLRALQRHFPSEPAGKRITDRDREARRDELFAKVQQILEHPLRIKLLDHIRDQSAAIGTICGYLVELHDALQHTETPQTVSVFLRQPKSTHPLTFSTKDRIIQTEADKKSEL